MNPVYLVVGAAGGIGSALCRRLSSQGAQLAVAGRNLERLTGLASEFNASAFQVDATSAEEVEQTVASVVEQFGQLDGIVNLAGSILLRPAHRTSPQEWRDVVATNLDSAFTCVRAATAAMQRSGGSIVLLSSAAARVGLPNHDAIAAAKAGVIGLAQSAAATYARRGVRVNVVAPGLVRTPLAEPITKNPASEKASVAMHRLGRLGEPFEVANAIAWLLDPAQSWITGQVLGVDGGLGTVRAS